MYVADGSMIEITRESVPFYLQCGEFYRTLDADDKDYFLVPASECKMSPTFQDLDELKHLLATLRYWHVGGEKYENEIIEFLLNTPTTDEVKCFMEQFEAVFPIIAKLKQVLTNIDAPALDIAAHLGPLEIVKALIKCAHKPTRTTLESAIRGNHIDILQYIVEEYKRQEIKSCPEDMKMAVETAAGAGCLAALQIFLSRGYNSTSACYYAAERGHLKCLEFLYSCHSHLFIKTSFVAACNGHLTVLQFLHEKGCPFHGKCCRMAATGGHLECLRFLHEIGLHWSVYVPSQAALGGHLDCLRFAHENGCDWDETTCADASEGGQLKCLQYAREHGCPWDARTTTNAVKHFPCLQYALENECPFVIDLVEIAFRARSDETGFHILQHCSNLSSDIYTYAAKLGRLDILTAAFNAHIVWHEDTCAVAAAAGHQDCVDFALLHGPRREENQAPEVHVPTPEEILTNSLCVERESFFD